MPRVRKPQTKYELYKKVLMMWWKAEHELIKTFCVPQYRKLRYKELKEKYDDLLKMWEDTKCY